MKRNKKDFMVLVVDDDQDDCQQFEDAYTDTGLPGTPLFFKSVAHLSAYLEQCKNTSNMHTRVSGVILLDLNMPVKHGLELLKEIKQDAKLNLIPIIIYTGSRSEVDIAKSYQFGANGYISKPTSYSGLVDTIRGLGDYWMKASVVPKCLLPESQVRV